MTYIARSQGACLSHLYLTSFWGLSVTFLCKNMRVLAYTCAGVCLSMSVGVYECEQMGVMEIKSRSVLAGADGRLA